MIDRNDQILRAAEMQIAIQAAVQAALAAHFSNVGDVARLPFAENPIADTRGSSIDLEELMNRTHYKWVSKPAPHKKRHRVWYREAGGRKGYRDFVSIEEATTWGDGERRYVLVGGHPVGEALTAYLDRRTDLAASTVTTLRHRLAAFLEGREQIAAEAFPWKQAWAAVATASADTQAGTLSALRGFVADLKDHGLVKGDVLAGLKVRGRKGRGKPQARIDEARRLIEKATADGDPAALAVVVALVFGLRAGEVVGLCCRDVDADASVLWIDGNKTAAAKRASEVPAELRPMLRGLIRDQQGTALLFRLAPQRVRVAKDPVKARKDHVTRRLRQLCAAVGIPRLVLHSLRGMHASFSREVGQTAHAVAAALGHTSTTVQSRHYLRPGLEAGVNATATQRRLLGVVDQNEASNPGLPEEGSQTPETTKPSAFTEGSGVRGGGIEPPWLLTASTSS
jgi:integrase